MQRSLAHLRADGWLVAIVEKWNAFAKIRQDAFGFGDLLAVRGDETALVQCTSAANVSHRLAKIRALPAARVWAASPHRSLLVHGWGKQGARGAKKTWVCRVNLVTFP